MKKSSPAKGKYLNAMIGIANVVAGSKEPTKDPGTAVEASTESGAAATGKRAELNKPTDKSFDLKSRDTKGIYKPFNTNQGGLSMSGSVSTTPVKKGSPYKMAGMSWKDGQERMSGKAAGKPSPNKELLTAVIVGGMVLGAVMDGVAGSKEAKAQKEMFNAEGKYNADVKNREFETLALDKKSKALEGFSDRASRKSEIYASAAANTKF